MVLLLEEWFFHCIVMWSTSSSWPRTRENVFVSSQNCLNTVNDWLENDIKNSFKLTSGRFKFRQTPPSTILKRSVCVGRCVCVVVLRVYELAEISIVKKPISKTYVFLVFIQFCVSQFCSRTASCFSLALMYLFTQTEKSFRLKESPLFKLPLKVPFILKKPRNKSVVRALSNL